MDLKWKKATKDLQAEYFMHKYLVRKIGEPNRIDCITSNYMVLRGEYYISLDELMLLPVEQ